MLRLLIPVFLAGPAFAESVIAVRTLRPHTVIGPGDITIVDADLPGALQDTALAIGRETRVAIYAGRPVKAEDLGAPTLVNRNQRVPIVYVSRALAIAAEGRALESGAVGDTVRVMNLGSRTTVSGIVGTDGSVYVGLED